MRVCVCVIYIYLYIDTQNQNDADLTHAARSQSTHAITRLPFHLRREKHRRRALKTYIAKISQPWWRGHWTPWAFLCLCSSRRVMRPRPGGKPVDRGIWGKLLCPRRRLEMGR